MAKINDILFWILIALIVGVAILLLITTNSPLEVDALISFALFISASEILLWRAIFGIDKKTSVSFEKVKWKIERLDNNMNRQFLEIKNLIKKNGN